jgi:hypothetical protein
MTRTTGSVSAGSVGLDHAVERLSKTRPVLWVVMGLMIISAFRSISFRHLGMTDWSALLGLIVALLLLLAYGDALTQLRTLRNQRNLERATMTHALVWAAMAVSAVWQLL